MPRPMKDSGVEWLGQIPSDWTIRSLKGVAERVIVGLATSVTQYYRDEGTPIFRNLNIKDDELTDDDVLYLDEEWASLQTGKMIKSGDILTVRTGYIGISCIVPEKYDDSLTFTTLITTPRKEIINTRFLMRYINISRFYSPIYFNVETGAQNNLNTKAFVNLEIAVPPLDEQQRIAVFLDSECARIDSVIEKTRASIAEYKKLKQSIITRAVTKGIRPNRQMKQSGIEWLGDIPADWEVIKLKHISRFMQTKYSAADEELNYIGLEHVISWCGTLVETDSTYDRDQSLICTGGDILFGKLRPYLAKVYLNTVKQCCSSEFAVIKMDADMWRPFFFYQLMSHRFIFTVDSSTYGTKMPRANAEFIKNMCVLVPPLDEQQEIAAYLDEKTAAIDSLVAKKNQLVSELESLKKSLIFEYVTGKKEII